MVRRALGGALLLGCAAAQPLNMSTSWPMLAQGPQRTARGPLLGPLASDDPTLLWESASSWAGSLPPVMGVGRVFGSTTGGALYALNASNGALDWIYLTGLTIASPPALGGRGIVYVTAYGTQLGDAEAASYLYAIDASQGTLKWTFPTGNAVLRSSPAIDAGGNVYFGASNTVYAIDGQTGRQVWQSAPCDGAMDSPPALSADGSLVYASSSAFTTYALSTATGAVVWQQTEACATGDCPAASGLQAVGSDGSVFALTQSRVLVAYGPNGTRKWSLPLQSGPLQALAVGVLDIVYASFSTSAAPPTAGVRAFNSATGGTLIWEAPIGGVTGLAVGFDGTLYVTTATTLASLSGLTGETLWSLPLDTPTLNSPAIGPGAVLYVVNRTGLGAVGAALAPTPAPTPTPGLNLVELGIGAGAGFVLAALMGAVGLCACRRRRGAGDAGEVKALLKAGNDKKTPLLPPPGPPAPLPALRAAVVVVPNPAAPAAVSAAAPAAPPPPPILTPPAAPAAPITSDV